MDDKKIISIEIKNTSWGLVCLEDVVKHQLIIHRTGIKHSLYNGLLDEPIKEYEYEVDLNTLDRFFDQLTSKIKVQEWDLNYGVEVCDGWVWECKIKFSDDTIKNVIGTVHPPPGAEEMKDTIIRLVAFKIKPWLF